MVYCTSCFSRSSSAYTPLSLPPSRFFGFSVFLPPLPILLPLLLHPSSLPPLSILPFCPPPLPPSSLPPFFLPPFSLFPTGGSHLCCSRPSPHWRHLLPKCPLHPRLPCLLPHLGDSSHSSICTEVWESDQLSLYYGIFCIQIECEAEHCGVLKSLWVGQL